MMVQRNVCIYIILAIYRPHLWKSCLNCYSVPMQGIIDISQECAIVQFQVENTRGSGTFYDEMQVKKRGSCD